MTRAVRQVADLGAVPLETWKLLRNSVNIADRRMLCDLEQADL